MLRLETAHARLRPITTRCTSLVPLYICASFASCIIRSTGYSVPSPSPEHLYGLHSHRHGRVRAEEVSHSGVFAVVGRTVAGPRSRRVHSSRAAAVRVFMSASTSVCRRPSSPSTMRRTSASSARAAGRSRRRRLPSWKPTASSASKLEKIDMLDLAELVVISKFDTKGAPDALHDARKQ